MTLQFDVFEDAGTFEYKDRGHYGLARELVELHDDLESGRVGEKVYLSAIERTLAVAPDLIDGHMFLALHFDEQGKPKKALDAALRGLAAANRLIPEGFGGLIEWGHLENRAYLRLLNLARQSYSRLRRHGEALKIIELMLERNPSDNQGVRYFLGTVALQSGDHARARAAFIADAADYPPYYYDLALSYMHTGEWVAAATALRRGFAANFYIAEMLTGHSDPEMLPIWHDGNLAEPETADEYIRTNGILWLGAAGGRSFMRWLFNHSKVMVERAAILECKELMLSAPDAPTRLNIAKREARLVAAIDDTISEAIVIKRKGAHGRADWPWSVG
jgi:tetratricopeptide (TPR) repeat protein